MNIGHTLYQIERPRTLDEQREEARLRGEMAAAIIRPWRRARRARQDRPAATRPAGTRRESRSSAR